MKTDGSGFGMTMRTVVLVSAVYFAFAAWTLGGKWLADGSFLTAFLAYSLLGVFLLLPPRLLAHRRCVAALLALPFPAWWFATLIDEGVSGASLGGILLLHIPLILQARLVVDSQARLRVHDSKTGGRGVAVQLRNAD